MWTKVGGPIPVGCRPIYSSSEVPISRINTEEVEVVINSSGHQSNPSPSHPASKRFQSQVVPSTPRDLQPVLSTIPSAIPPLSPNPSTARHALVSKMRPSPIPQRRNSPIVTSQQLQHSSSSSRRRED
ncbi:hypothetical protein O181_056867 [Austropuccinia psidii MF-1]|uniref:Uncharacterized protein n=1 Tax=Austropuccinia psidii MF-1 TaxID=1389203 RepID=A0A9Q3HUV7_9BASI|nr:hypothetical protein [Austropuccinia psidii MF-1]